MLAATLLQEATAVDGGGGSEQLQTHDRPMLPGDAGGGGGGDSFSCQGKLCSSGGRDAHMAPIYHFRSLEMGMRTTIEMLIFVIIPDTS